MEKLLLIPAEHWNGDILAGITVHVLNSNVKFSGALTFKPCDVKKALKLTATHLTESGYNVTSLLYGEKYEGTNFEESTGNGLIFL